MASVFEQFLRDYARDLVHQRVQPLRVYQERFPSVAEAIAEEYAKLEAERAASDTEETDENCIGPYRLEAEIGRGGQGVVYKATDTRVGRTVALKVLNAMTPLSEEALARFHREAKVGSRLDDPGICTVYDTGLDQGIPYVAMRYVAGESLSHLISTHRNRSTEPDASTHVVISETSFATPSDTQSQDPQSDHPKKQEIAAILSLLEKVARSLQGVHDAGILHRDIKPGNIMVEARDQRPVLLDFGLARSDDEDLPTLTQRGDLFGTPAYMSPEQLTAHHMRLDARTDVWSLGASLYECLTLRRPFEAPTREGLYQAIQSKDPIDPRALNPAISKDLRVVLQTTLEKDRDRRYQTAKEFADELQRVRLYEPIHARPVGRWVRTRRWAQRNPAVATLSALLVLSLVGGLAISLAALRAEQNARQESDRNLLSWRRMSDVRLIQDLEQEAEADLWPAWPSKLPQLNHWIERARDLLSRLPLHESTLSELRAAAEPYTEIEAARDHSSHPKLPQLTELKEKRNALLKPMVKLEDGIITRYGQDPLTKFEADLDEILKAEIEEKRAELGRIQFQLLALEKAIMERRTWRFTDPTQQYRHEVFTALVAGLKRLQGEDGLLAEVRKRHIDASKVEKRSIANHQSAWDSAISRVARDGRFPEFQLGPQIGLIPLGPDPVSKLEEFGLLDHTGPLPIRDPETHKLTITDTSGIVLVLIPGGTFTMGANPDADPEILKLAKPQHSVTLPPFFISKYEVTQAQWQRVMGINPSRHPEHSPSHPVEQVSWVECKKMTFRLGLSLPTEAQWEYAARAESTEPWWYGAGEDEVERFGAVKGKTSNSSKAPKDSKVHRPVSSFEANPFGLHDVIGNVYEWCRDGIRSYDDKGIGPYCLRPALDKNRVIRGGSFNTEPHFCRVDHRHFNPRNYVNDQVGLRPVLNLVPETEPR